MKKIAPFFISLLFFALTAQAQAPQAFKYQTVVRNAAGQVLANQAVRLKFDLLGNDTLYSETHAPTTNAFGLVNLEIGRGALMSGTFANIDWNQPIHILVSLDATGGTNYQYMGGSELLSVPYALYATKAGSSGELPAGAQKGDLLYHDGTTWQRLAAGAAGTVLTMGSNGLPVWKVLPSQLDSLLKVTMTNGEVIYVSPVNQITFVDWGGFGADITAVTNILSTAEANIAFNGEANTQAIVAQLGSNNGTAYAAKVCADLSAYGFDDWYLPAVGELNEMYKKLGPASMGGNEQITTGIYWSSTESTSANAWNQHFANGAQFLTLKTSDLSCRCIRK